MRRMMMVSLLVMCQDHVVTSSLGGCLLSLSLQFIHLTLTNTRSRGTYNLKGISHLFGVVSPLILNLVQVLFSLLVRKIFISYRSNHSGVSVIYILVFLLNLIFEPLSVAIGKTSARAYVCVSIEQRWVRERKKGRRDVNCLLNITCDSRDAHWTIRPRVSGHYTHGYPY